MHDGALGLGAAARSETVGDDISGEAYSAEHAINIRADASS